MYTFVQLRNFSTLLNEVHFKRVFTVRKQLKVETVRKSSLTKNTPRKMKLESPEFKSTITEDVKFLFKIFTAGGFEMRIAGGAVRDLLLGNTPQDIDFATTSTPKDTKLILKKCGIRLIHSNGESHGTIMARHNEKNYEITTLRADVVTYGRHAKVEYTTDWYTDASRRDLTINALFLDLDGNVYDYFNGIDDLKKRRVAFVGDASQRIKEDYLRILRFFRFHGKIDSPLDSFEDETINAIKSNAEGLNMISGERIKSEMFKIIKGNNGIEILRKMLSIKIGPYMGLPEGISFDELDRISELIKKHKFDMNPITILCAVVEDEMQITQLVSRMKTSAYERDLGLFIVQEREKNNDMKQPLSHFQCLTLLARKKKTMRSAVQEYLMYAGDVDLLEKYMNWKEIRFPMGGFDVINYKKEYKRHANEILEKLMVKWVESEFTLTKNELMQFIDDIVNDISTDERLASKRGRRRSLF